MLGMKKWRGIWVIERLAGIGTVRGKGFKGKATGVLRFGAGRRIV